MIKNNKINPLKKLIFLIVLIMIVPCAHGTEGSDPPPLMVQKHIFSPEPDEEENKEDKNEEKTSVEQKRALKRIDRLLNFSGVIKTQASKKALIRNKSNRDETSSVLYQEGDNVIDDYALEEIHPNYIILAGKEEKVQINLFKDRSDRPAPQVIPEQTFPTDEPGKTSEDSETSASDQSQSQKSTPSQAQKQTSTGSDQKNTPSKTSSTPDTESSAIDSKKNSSKNPFIEALKKAAQKKNTQGSSSSNNTLNSGSTNPFLEAIKRARNQQN